MTSPQPEHSGVPDRDVDSAPNTDNTVNVPRCSTPDTQCLVCWLRDKVAKDPETKYTGFRSGALEVNIVGIRRKDSITDSFDDFFFLFYRLAVPEDNAAFETAIERDLRDNWKEQAFEDAKDRTRLVPCGKDGCLWAVALYDKLSTDPGLTDFPEEKYAKTQSDLGEKIKAKKAEIAAKNAESQLGQQNIDEKKLALDRTNDDVPPPKKGTKPKPGTKAAAAAEVAALEKTQAKLVKDQARLVADLADLERQQNDNDTKLAAANAEAATRDPTAVIGDGKDGGLAVGRAMIPCGVYEGQYRFGVHHLHSADHLGNAHVALTIGEIPNGYRFYSADYLRSAAWQKASAGRFVRKTVTVGDASVQRIVVGEHIPKGSTKGKTFPEGSAVLVEKSNPDGTVDIEIDDRGSALPVAKGDVIALRAPIGGTNLHRAHYAKLSGAHLVERRAGGDSVKTWSEGCQVNQRFAHFNQFIRTCAVSKRFHCATKKKNAGDPGCARLTASDSEELGHGEQVLVQTVGERTINEAALRNVKKRLAEVKADVSRLEKKQAAWTPDKQAALDTLRADPVPNKAALSKLAPAEFTPADQVSLDAEHAEATELDAALTQLDAEVGRSKQKADLDGVFAKQEEIIKRAQKHIDTQTAANKTAKHPKTDDELAASLKKDNELKAKAEEAKAVAKTKMEDLDKNPAMKKEALERRRGFIRERTRFLAADFLRECDLKGACPEKFTYLLIEFDDATCEGLKKRFADGKNVTWDGALVLPGDDD